MKLVIVAAKNFKQEEIIRIETSSSLSQVLTFLSILGMCGWDLYDKGNCRLERNYGDIYLSVGPADLKDVMEFLWQAAGQSIHWNRASVPYEIMTLATEVIGDPQAAWIWLSTPNHVFSGAKPVDLLIQPDGSQIILDTLGRIAWGVYS